MKWLLAAFVVLGLAYDSATPIFEASDEQSHYPYVKSITDGDGLPIVDPSHIQAWRQEGSQPPLYYLIGALATFWLDTRDFGERYRVNPHAILGIPEYASNDNRNMLVHTGAENFPYRGATLAVHVIRWLSILMGAATVYLTYRLALLITASEWTALLSALLVAFNPMFGFLSGAVNNDNLVILLATLALVQMTVLWQRELTRRRVALLGVTMGLAVLSKLGALGLLGVAGLLITVRSFWAVPLGGKPVGHTSGSLLSMGAVAVRRLVILYAPVLLIAGWWYLRNLWLYGDVTGLNRMLAVAGTRAGTPPLLPLLQAEAEGFWLSYWGLFGGVNILGAPWVYLLFDTLTLFALAGLLSKFIGQTILRANRSARPSTWVSLARSGYLWLALWLVVLLAAWARWTWLTPATQGRLIFPGMAVIAMALAAGLLALIPRRLAGMAVVLIGVVLWGVSLRVALVDIRSAYTPAPLVSEVPARAAREPIRFGEVMELVGAELPKLETSPSDTVDVVLYWKAIAPMSRDYSVFLHLLDAGNVLVSQRDTYPGLGLRPTTQLRPGEIVREVYRVFVDPAVLASNQLQWRAGLYDFTSSQRLPASLHDQTVDDNPRLGMLEPPSSPSGTTPNPLHFTFEDYFTLTGYWLDPVAVRAGHAFTLMLYWEARKPAPKDYSIFTHVLRQDETLWGQLDRQLPTTTWQAGQLVVDTYVIQVKPQTPAGVYE
ncbi:MAG: phospholipid carrier-dependent glycosyltransferase, partial [Chloroflexi bacterium]|nr:phospholipid carrier-dependent glycosyltransferase [Chloroflexota bacterium]